MRTFVYLVLVAAGAAMMLVGVLGMRSAIPADLDKMQRQVLAVSAQLNGNCSSTLIHSAPDEDGDVVTLFLTAKHCVKNARGDMKVDIPVYQNGRVVKQDSYVATLGARHYLSDLAIVELKDRETRFETTATIAPKDTIPDMGTRSWTVGYPLGKQLTITEGLFGALETIDYPKPGTEYFRASPDAARGNSGGALYVQDDKGDYVLVGVTAVGYRGFPYMTLYTPLHDIHAFLDRALPDPADDGGIDESEYYGEGRDF